MKFCLVVIFTFIHSAHAATAVRVPGPNQGVKDVQGFSWSACSGCAQPESVYVDGSSNSIYVSNVDGEPGKKDGKGHIQKLQLNGKVSKEKWVDGLNAPKGMRSYKGKLYVTDIDELVIININSGKIHQKIPAPGAKFLNDVAITPSGTVYISDTLDNKIYEYKNGKLSVFAEGESLTNPNGLLIRGTDLIVASWGKMEPDWSTKVPGKLYKLNLKTKEQTFITPDPTGNLDGLELDQKGNYLVSDWMAGKVLRISPEGATEVLFEGMKGAADIGFHQGTNMLFIPRMGENEIIAYNLSKFPKE